MERDGEGGVWEGRWGISIPPGVLRAQDECLRGRALPSGDRGLSQHTWLEASGWRGFSGRPQPRQPWDPGRWVSPGAAGETGRRQGAGLWEGPRGPAVGRGEGPP